MKFGILLSGQYHTDTDMVAALEGQLTMLRFARDRGWDSYFGNQHYLQEGDLQMLQIVPYLARMHADAGPMTMGVGLVLLTLQNPVDVAETIASLDVIARGNMVFGVGLGYRNVEFDAFGIRKGHRVRRFEQCLDIVKRLWTEDEVTFENEVWKLNKAHLTLRPVQKPRPPVWIAAKHPNAVRRAA
ncbi:MAG: LLM class flavin-dependent oxidoreductase, partial [Candidatus Lambdaproteobacteria bacterium]|nr:LLM class flavin-dependent oxidoreductase [Candidatus Lambdaproteobacteria bacterium]